MTHANRARVTLVFEPQWGGLIEGWAKKYIWENKWRCDRVFGYDDLLQEAWLIFHKLSYYYPRVVEPAVFMGLFKLSLINWFNDRASYMQRKNTCHSDLSSDVSDLGDVFGEMCDQHLNILLREAPEELKLALALIVNEPDKLKPLRKQFGNRENLNMRLRRILGLRPGFDLKAALTELLFT